MKKTILKSSLSLLLAVLLCMTLVLPVAYADEPAEVTVIEDVVDEAAPVDETPAEQPADETPTEETPVEDETPADDELIELSVDEIVEEEIPADETPAEKTPAAKDAALSDKTAAEDAELSSNYGKTAASIDVVSETITYGQKPALVINTNPANLDYVRVIAGIDGDAQNFISIDFPASTKELMKIKVNGITVFDGYSYIANSVGDGVSVSEFRSIVNGMIASINANAAYKSACIKQGLDLSAFRTVYGVLDQISALDATAKVRLGQAPKNAGVYLVTAISTDLSCCQVSDTGYLTIKPKTSSAFTKVELRFNKLIPGMYNVLSYEDAQTFEFGGKMYINNFPKESTHVKAMYVGSTFDGKFISHQSEPIREPGVYTETVYVVGGNYYATPIVRTYTVDRRRIELVMEDETVTYDGQPHSLTATDKNGTDLGDAVTYFYVGFGYMSYEAPVNAGVYTVYANYAGDKMNKPAVAVAKLTIERAPATVTVSCAETVIYGDIDAEHMDAAQIDMTADGLCGDDHLGAFKYELVDDSNFPNVGEYQITAVPIFFTNPNYKITIVDATLTIIPRDVTITFDEKTKIFGDPDPELTVRISDLGYGVPVNYELSRDEGEDVGRYAIHCTLGENPNYNITLVNEANSADIENEPELSGKFNIAATGVDGTVADEEEVTCDFYITPRPVDVAVGSATKYEDEPDPEIPVDITDDDGTAYDGETVGLEIERVWDEELNGYWLIPSISNTNYELRNAQEGFLKILKRSTPIDDDNKEESKPAAPKTGDMSTLFVFLMTVVMALAAAVLIRFRKKSN